MRSSLRVLHIAASVELISLIVLLANLATMHWPAVSLARLPDSGHRT
ncbi:MAG: hypothetical protein ACRDS9_26830 [Pseudonocardiaceae bacterium]